MVLGDALDESLCLKYHRQTRHVLDKVHEELVKAEDRAGKPRTKATDWQDLYGSDGGSEEMSAGKDARP